MKSTKHFGEGDTLIPCQCAAEYCNGKGGFSTALLIVLEDVRVHFGKPVSISGGNRCTDHNKAERGAENSKHLPSYNEEAGKYEGNAADIKVKDVDPIDVYKYLDSRPYRNLLGLGIYHNRIHVDVARTYPARWDTTK